MRATQPVGGAVVLLASLLFAPPVAAHEFVATVTLVEGRTVLISGAHGYAPAAGVRLRHADILQTGLKSLVQLETGDGGVIELGPDTRFLADLPYRRGEDPVIGPHYLLSGWVKLTVPKRAEATPHRINTPFFDLAIEAGIAVLHAGADAAQFFVESGGAFAIETAGGTPTRVAVPAGSMYSFKAGVRNRPLPAFVQAMPPAFRDTLPPRLAKLKGRTVEPKPARDYSYADVEGWLKGDPEVRQALVQTMRAKAKDPDFRAALIDHMADHPEWNAVVR